VDYSYGRSNNAKQQTTNNEKQQQLDFELPSDLESERMVLGAALSDSEAFSLIAGILQAEDFSVEKHRRIFLCMGELVEQGLEPSPSTVALELRKRDQLELCDGWRISRRSRIFRTWAIRSPFSVIG
jgi:hypothetical protein